MALLQISEPDKNPDSLQQVKKKRAIGIDLGTTNSLVATVQSGSAAALEDQEGKYLFPSVVWYGEMHIEVGRKAKEHASQDPLNTIISVKRLMGRGIRDVMAVGGLMPYQFVDTEGGMPFISTRIGPISPVAISAEILKTLACRAELQLGGTLDGAVITVPAYFDDAQRQATKDAAKLAGIHVYRLLNEPTAAAVAYGLDTRFGDERHGVIAVYDLGGGTFDVSILSLEKGVFQVLATGGDTALGGDDFDQLLAQWLLEQSGLLKETINHDILRDAMITACEIKEELSEKDSVNIAFQGWSGVISREHFNTIIDPLINRTIRSFKKTLRDAGINVEDVREIVMVGGSTRIPRVRSSVEAFAGQKPLTAIDPEQVVAIGAAQQADILAGNGSCDELLLLDVIPLSLGVETMGGLMEKIIDKNTTIPASRAQEFTTAKDGQTAMIIHVFQGERELVTNNRSLARFVLKDIPAWPAGAAKIRVTFQVDADGLLSVSAEEMVTNVKSSIEVKPSYGLGDQEISRMITESYNNAGEDLTIRRLREKEIEADRLMEALGIALEKDGQALLSAAEMNTLVAALDTLKEVRESCDPDVIEANIKSVNKLSEAFAARRMNEGIRQALSGQNINNLEDF